jgi:hypothetical protein
MGLTATGTTFHPLWAQRTPTQPDTDIYTTTVTR